MSSSDWWTSSTPSSSFHTPGRNPAAQLGSSSSAFSPSTSRARFAGDELDPEDAKMADGIKFLPTFASSPAGKLAFGAGSTPQSPPGGMASVGSVSRRSPTARFTDGSSPRNAPTPGMMMPRRSLPAPMVDEEMPPTTSWRDAADTPTRTIVQSPPTLPTPPALTPTSTTTTLNIFGPPPAVLPDLQPYLASIGDILSYTAGPEGSNWWTVTYASPTSAAYCLRRHGELIQGRWILGVTVASSATSGASPSASGSGFGNLNGASAGPNNAGRWEIAQPPRSAEMLSDHSGAGTPLRPREGNALRSKTPVQVKKEDYAWEEQQSESGVMGKVADWLFGR